MPKWPVKGSKGVPIYQNGRWNVAVNSRYLQSGQKKTIGADDSVYQVRNTHQLQTIVAEDTASHLTNKLQLQPIGAVDTKLHLTVTLQFYPIEAAASAKLISVCTSISNS